MRPFFIILLFITMTALFPFSSPAATLKFSEKPYVHVSEEQPIEEFLREFCSNQGIKTIISKAVGGKTVSGKFNMKPGLLFKQITATFDLISYFDGNFLYIYHADEAVSKFVNLSHMSAFKLRRILRRNRILDPDFPVKFYRNKKLIYVSGPPVYVALIEDAANMLDTKEAREIGIKEAGEAIRFFRLKYAWAADFTFNVNNSQISVPGVATILHNLLSNEKNKNASLLQQEHRPSVNAAKLPGLGSSHKNAQKTPTKPLSPPPPISDTGGTIQAAPRLNAVIVRDVPAKMPFYEKLIEELDVPIKLVEIKATIMDIDTDALKQFGADWAIKDNNKRSTNWFSSANATDSPFGGAAFDPQAGLQANLGGGFNFTTILGDLTDDFVIARLNVLAEEGSAKIISRPSIITFDNVEARLEHSRKFYVRVAGDQDVNLFEVSTGITLKVTPHIIDDEEQSEINLTVSVQDGTLSDTSVDNIPVVDSSTLHTQAMVKEHESLLIGGLIHESTSNTERKIPFFGDLPLLGTLFKYETNNKTKSERLFLISPRIVDSTPQPSLSSLTDNDPLPEVPLPSPSEGVGKTP